MTFKRNVLMTATLIIFGLAAAVTGVRFARSSALAQEARQRKTFEYRVEWIKRKVPLDKKTNEREGELSVAIRLNGLQAVDYVNIRPSENSVIEVTAGAIPRLSLVNVGANEKTDEPLTKSSLEVTKSEVVFTRPVSITAPVLIDVQVPSGKQVQIIADGNTLLSASLREGEPLSLRGQQIGQGVLTLSEAMTQVFLPPGLPSVIRGGSLRKSEQNVVQPLGNSDKYLVPFHKLQVVKKVAVEGSPLQIIAKLEIDETGRVVSVQPVGTSPAPGLEETLKQWQFAPYQVGGRAVRVITQFTPADR